MNPPTLQMTGPVPVAEIDARSRLRPVSAAGVEALKASIIETGVMKDAIHVRKKKGGAMVLIAGAHRLEAARQLGWSEIEAKVWTDVTDDWSRLMEIDDNLAGAEMGPLDTAVFLAERKAVYERLHPETKQGVAGALARHSATDIMSVASFAVTTAEKFGLSDRHVRRLVEIGASLSKDELRWLRASPAPIRLTDLQALAKIGEPRPLTAVSDHDLVFAEAFFGAPFPVSHREAAHILAGVLGSALAAWYFLMTAAEFGLYKRRLFRQDVALLPTPDLNLIAGSNAGQKIFALEQKFRTRAPNAEDWIALDEAVFDLYDLDTDDRIVVRDGLFKAGWQWNAGLSDSMTPAAPRDTVAAYAKTFSTVLDRWLSARRQRRVKAEVFDLRGTDAMRIVRFVLEDGAKAPEVEIVSPDGSLAAVFARLEDRMKVPLASALTGQRELRIHSRNEVVIIKPAARRHWLESVALEDADAVIAESFAGRRN